MQVFTVQRRRKVSTSVAPARDDQERGHERGQSLLEPYEARGWWRRIPQKHHTHRIITRRLYRI